MKKKILFLFLLLSVSIAGGAFAANIQSSVIPKEGPETWVTAVYNNSGSNLDAGDVVVWDIGNSTGDNDNYVTTTTTADTHLVAGVVWPEAINASEDGTIAIFGYAQCDLTDNLPAGTFLCSSSSAGNARSCANNDANFGHTVTVGSGGGGNINCFLKMSQ